MVRDRGAKVIVYHGVSDAIFSVNDTTAWYEGLRAANGGDASSFARFFRVPGMAHCGGGPSTDQFDMLTALVEWVEHGEAPDRVVAYARGAGNLVGVNPDVPSGWSPRSQSAALSAPEGGALESGRHRPGDGRQLQLPVRVQLSRRQTLTGQTCMQSCRGMHRQRNTTSF